MLLGFNGILIILALRPLLSEAEEEVLKPNHVQIGHKVKNLFNIEDFL